jgi:orotidine-5'-phosphate decarboxylase
LVRRPDIAVALDLGTAMEALALVDSLGDAVSWYKVGAMQAVTDGPLLVEQLKARGKSVFLDLKWHDIPNTVAGAVGAAAWLGASLATVHLSGGRAMLEAASKARAGSKLRLVGGGVLTSFDEASYGAVVGRDVSKVQDEQLRLMRVAEGLLDGFVCAVAEAPAVRQLAGAEALLVTPGIRDAADAAGDQRRTATAAEAVRSGSDLLVIGRPITGAPDPARRARDFQAELAQARPAHSG